MQFHPCVVRADAKLFALDTSMSSRNAHALFYDFRGYTRIKRLFQECNALLLPCEKLL